MLNKSQRDHYIRLENSLIDKYSHIKENELALVPGDFKDGKLRASSFDKLKDEAWYIPYDEPVVIKAPLEVKKTLKDDLEFFASRQLSKIRKDRREARIHGTILFGVGLLILIVLAVAIFLSARLVDIMIVTELVTIISWVFVWAGVTKFFIDRREIVDKRFTILQMLDAEIHYGSNESGEIN